MTTVSPDTSPGNVIALMRETAGEYERSIAEVAGDFGDPAITDLYRVTVELMRVQIDIAERLAGMYPQAVDAVAAGIAIGRIDAALAGGLRGIKDHAARIAGRARR